MLQGKIVLISTENIPSVYKTLFPQLAMHVYMYIYTFQVTA